MSVYLSLFHSDMNIIQSQFIDGYGKCIMVSVENIIMVISPVAPLSKIPVIENLSQLPSIETVTSKILKPHKIEIISQDGTEKGINGIWVNSDQMSKLLKGKIYYCFIPVKKSEPLENVEFTLPDEQLNVINKSGSSTRISDLEQMREGRKIAEVLKQYALFLYSHHPEKDEEGNLTDIEENIVVVEGFKYDIDALPKKVSYDTEMWQGKKLIVPSEDIKRRLIQFISVFTLNLDPMIFRNVRLSIFTSLNDFTARPETFIFNDLKTVRNIMEISKQKNNAISSNLDSTVKLPYLYRSKDINGSRIAMIQNVLNGDLKRAATVSKIWIDERVNKGFESKKLRNIEKIIIFKQDGSVEEKDGGIPIFQYDNGEYCALLFL